MSSRPPIAIAAVALPHLPVELARLPAGGAAVAACGVVVDPGDGVFAVRSVTPLVDATPEARAAGVRPGMRVLDAQRVLPMLQVVAVARARIDAELAVLAEALLLHAPGAEPVPLEVRASAPIAAVLLDVRNLPQLGKTLVDVRRSCAHLGHEAVIVAAAGKRTALALARQQALAAWRAPVVDERRAVVVVADEARALARLPLVALGLPAPLTAQVGALGVKTVRDLLRLLDRGGVERLGEHARGVLASLLSRAEPVRSVTPPARLLEQQDLEHPLAETEPLAFVLKPLALRLVVRARARRMRVAEVELCLRHRRAAPTALRVAFPAPILDEATLLRALSVRLEQVVLPLPVEGVLLEATRLVEGNARQLALDPRARVEERAGELVSGLVAEMAAELGTARVGCLVVEGDPLPERMSALAWPAPPPPALPPVPKRRRPRPRPTLPHTIGGRFLASWPWPVRLLDVPVKLALPVVKRELFGVLEGQRADDTPYARVYQLLVLEDGRRALGLWDEETEETLVQGWFD
ncbi:MAG: hypothetical protein HYS27_00230 [Deltaproteobacteria bacterium]|nr:hypothetical protein [Deltaproteobacteria bacterium]